MNDYEKKSRRITERIVVEADLELLAPTSFGSGDAAGGTTDMPLLVDEIEGLALLTGTSIAGALRNYLRERENGFAGREFTDENGNRLTETKNGKAEKIPLPVMTHLFGSIEEDGAQSCLIVDDALGYWKRDGKTFTVPQTELRDGVRIEAATRTAKTGAKFDLELLEAGTKFPLRFEFLISDAKDKSGNLIFPSRDELVKALTIALKGFEAREIHLGRRKRRGYGKCEVKSWKVKSYDLRKFCGLVDWLDNGAKKIDENAVPPKPILEAVKDNLGIDLTDSNLNDRRAFFEMTADFALDGSLLIRSGSKLDAAGNSQPDAVHLRSNRNGNSQPIISGTSLAGVLRHRALRIANTINLQNDFVEKIFGVDMDELKERNKIRKKNGLKDEQPFASRLEVEESVLDAAKTNSLVQTRVKIDRFTGGAFESALFDAAPVFASNPNEKIVTLKMRLRENKETSFNAEIGLLLLLLKDLWTSDLPVGGESSIGRGRLKGISACLRYQKSSNNWTACLSNGADGKIEIAGDKDYALFNGLVDELNAKFAREQNDGKEN